MQVIKRDGRSENVSFDKIIARIQGLQSYMKLDRVNAIEIAKETVRGLRDKITTIELDTYAADKCAERIMDDPQYGTLGAGICVSNLHKNTFEDFLQVTMALYNNCDNNNKHIPLVTEEYVNFVKNNIEIINKTLNYNNDYLYDFFAIKTLENAYLIKVNKKIVERPQHMIMRVSLAIHHNNIDDALETYTFMSNRYFTHASPTLYNAASPRPQLSSCFLLHMNDSVEGIFNTVGQVAAISKYSGGIGIHIQDVRANGSLIRGTNGNTRGIIPIIKILNETGKCINQGGKRNGAIAIYVEPWHADIFEFCELKKNTGIEETKARDIFLGLWIPDLFMKRVKEKGIWSLMCPDKCPGLTDAYGDAFEELYTKYEKEKKYNRQVNAVDLWKHIMEAQIETGIPYMHYKDHANRLSNQQNIGTIKSSNLCGEIIEYSDENEIAVCNLASICLPTFIKNGVFDFKLLSDVAGIITKNLNKIIDINFYPVIQAKNSNLRHRPIGIGVQGLADIFCILNIPYESEQARTLNKGIFEAIYYGSLKSSCAIAKIEGPYSTFEGSPFSKGQLQYHLWGLDESNFVLQQDWLTLIEDIKKYGTRNSLLTTIMPTATTSQIMGFNECTEPYTTNIYTRTTLAGEYTLVNRYLIEKLIELGLWTNEIKDELLFDNGSVQNISVIPDNIKEVFKTAFEMKIKPLLQLAIDRGPFIDQSQSMNIFMATPDFNRLSSSHIFAWENKLKTGMYYLRSQPAVNPIKFGLEIDTAKHIAEKREVNKPSGCGDCCG